MSTESRDEAALRTDQGGAQGEVAADLRAAYEAKVQDFAVETWVVSKAHEWATTDDDRFAGDLADVGVDRGRRIAKRELLAVLSEARRNAPAKAEGTTETPPAPSGAEADGRLAGRVTVVSWEEHERLVALAVAREHHRLVAARFPSAGPGTTETPDAPRCDGCDGFGEVRDDVTGRAVACPRCYPDAYETDDVAAPPATGEGDREALSELLWRHLTSQGWDGLDPAETQSLADAVLAAGFRRAGSGEARLTEAERESVAEARRGTLTHLVAAVERILADRAAGENDLRARLTALVEQHWDWKAGAVLHRELRAALAVTGGDHDAPT